MPLDRSYIRPLLLPLLVRYVRTYVWKERYGDVYCKNTIEVSIAKGNTLVCQEESFLVSRNLFITASSL